MQNWLMNDSLLFRFGLISDIQYADIEDASNFSGSEHRAYRDSARHTTQIINYWSALNPQLSFIAQLGDLIDGQNAGEYGQGLNLDGPQSDEALTILMNAWRDCPIPTFHAVGNHELYNFSWEKLADVLNGSQQGSQHRISIPSSQVSTEDQRFYFSWRPHPNWRMIMLNCYEMSVIRPLSENNHAEAEALLRSHNPNYGKPAPCNYFDGLSRDKLRFVPFNGGLGEQQRTWLKSELDEAKQVDEQVLVMGHLPLYPEAASPRNVAFDADEALSVLQQSGCVAAYFAGHRHRGGYAQDTTGIHHVTVQAPLIHGYCAATADVYSDRITICGEGAHKSYRLTLLNS